MSNAGSKFGVGAAFLVVGLTLIVGGVTGNLAPMIAAIIDPSILTASISNPNAAKQGLPSTATAVGGSLLGLNTGFSKSESTAQAAAVGGLFGLGLNAAGKL